MVLHCACVAALQRPRSSTSQPMTLTLPQFLGNHNVSVGHKYMGRWLKGSGAPLNTALVRKLWLGWGRARTKTDLPTVGQIIELVSFGRIALQVFLSVKKVVFNKTALKLLQKLPCLKLLQLAWMRSSR